MVMDIGTVLLNWQSMGIFSYLLPFLLIFALVFAILQKTKILGDQKGLTIIISVVIGFLALQLDFVPTLFPELFSRLGIGLAVLLVLMIFVGVFIDSDESNKWGKYVYMGVGAIIFITILFQAFSRWGWYSYDTFTGDMVGWVVLALLVIGVIVVAAVSGGKK